MIVGTCSICGGRVTIPDVWGAIIPPTPTCESCGAVAAQNGPIIPMTHIKYKTTYSTSSDIIC